MDQLLRAARVASSLLLMAIPVAAVGQETGRCNPNGPPDVDSLALSVPPRLLNGAEAREAVRRLHPVELRRSGRGGSTWVSVLISKTGAVQGAQIRERSQLPAIDSAALALTTVLEFAPAYSGRDPVCTWFEFPVRFPDG